MRFTVATSLIFIIGIASGQAPVDRAPRLARQAGEITPGDAVNRSAKFLAQIGEAPMSPKSIKVNLLVRNQRTGQRVYDVNDGPRRFMIDSVTGSVEFYALSSYVFLKAPAARTAVLPTTAKTESTLSNLVQAANISAPKRIRYVVKDQNPSPDADPRGYVSAVYQGSDSSRVHIVLDRQSGRLENLIRTHPRLKAKK